MADNARAKRLADLIREVVAEKLQRGIKDPRLGSRVTITDTRVTGDLREATVFYTVYGDDEERAQAAKGLESAKGVLRSAVGAAAGVKFTPTLAFVPDALPENAKNIDDVLERARLQDEQVRSTAAGAEYAAGADPYKRDRDEDDEDDSADGKADPGEPGPGAARDDADGGPAGS
ncbi:30S ribosome-binding factor RbfA [Streptomyces sp. CMB-StM0423]|uniref:30S ribosome-binding factor RbfA n=1 Tax=Streptomyces sp. CMB-StM0423 TaxID=2059884 RepID=UPI000C70F780|nr:30S ribosome-binding factor RbfA [Streptomyces sp. CMB-StM0423]AUH40177.1 30S ribosome-binding factor RbfA [Streptomyces sp. CMB-StM0423]